MELKDLIRCTCGRIRKIKRHRAPAWGNVLTTELVCTCKKVQYRKRLFGKIPTVYELEKQYNLIETKKEG